MQPDEQSNGLASHTTKNAVKTQKGFPMILGGPSAEDPPSVGDIPT